MTCTSHVASKLEELIIVDSSTKRNKKEMSESSTQNRGVEYMFWRPKHASFDREDMRNNGKVLFYTSLPSFEVLEALYEHVAPHISRKLQNLTKFQELLIKLRLKCTIPPGDINQ